MVEEKQALLILNSASYPKDACCSSSGSHWCLTPDPQMVKRNRDEGQFPQISAQEHMCVW